MSFCMHITFFKWSSHLIIWGCESLKKLIWEHIFLNQYQLHVLSWLTYMLTDMCVYVCIYVVHEILYVCVCVHVYVCVYWVVWRSVKITCISGDTVWIQISSGPCQDRWSCALNYVWMANGYKRHQYRFLLAI